MRFPILKVATIVFVAIIVISCKQKDQGQEEQAAQPRSIHYAALTGNKAALEEFLKVGVGVDSRDKFWAATPLHFAAGQGQKEITQILIAKGADVNAKDKKGATPLMYAMKGRVGAKEVTDLLIANGADINAKASSTGYTPLHVAVLNGQPEMVTFLLEKGADVNAKMDDGQTPLDLAISLSQKHFRWGSAMASRKKEFEKCAQLLQQYKPK
jgi:ankyrin repeat protein